MDPYSEILSGLKLQGAIFFRAEFSAPWFIKAPPSPKLAAALGLERAHVVNFHLLTEGEARVELPAGGTLGLTAGEIVIFPYGDAHYLMSTDGACRVEDAAVAAKVRARDLSPLRCGGGGAAAKFVCGYMACDPFFCRSVVSGLPTVISVNIRSDSAGRWMESSLLHLLEEVDSNTVGSTAMRMAAIAAQVGYESEAAFNRAFSRELGMPPARYRSTNRLSREEGRP
jgi:AraC-like DNA-binding protein